VNVRGTSATYRCSRASNCRKTSGFPPYPSSKVAVSDESKFFEQRDVPALIKTIGEWNEQLAAFVGAIGDKMVKIVQAPILNFPNFEHLEAKGQNQLDAFLRMLKDDGKERPSQ
jgi:hypothetical protein